MMLALNMMRVWLWSQHATTDGRLWPTSTSRLTATTLMIIYKLQDPPPPLQDGDFNFGLDAEFRGYRSNIYRQPV